MSKDMFGVETNIAGAWHIDEAVLVIEKGEQLLAQDVNMQYARPITSFQPINRKGRFLIGGTGAGSISIGVIIGPNKAVRDFLAEYADLCKAKDHVVILRPAGVQNCDEAAGDPVEFVASGVALEGIQLSVATVGQLAVVRGGLQLMITTLDVK